MVEWDPAAADRAVAADRVRLEQVFVNLIQNALDATAGREDARIEISIAEAGGRIAVDLRRQRRRASRPMCAASCSPRSPPGARRGSASAWRSRATSCASSAAISSSTSTGAKGSVFTATAGAGMRRDRRLRSVILVEDDEPLRAATVQALELAGFEPRGRSPPPTAPARS